MRLSVRNHAGVPAAELARLDALVGPLRTLQDVVRLGLAQHPPLLIRDVVIQDEFTHDVVLPLGPSRYLVFDST